VSVPRRTREPADLTDADIAAIVDTTGLAPEVAFDLLVARAIGAALEWDTPSGPWTEKVIASTRRARTTALRLARACGIG